MYVYSNGIKKAQNVTTGMDEERTLD